MKKWIAILLAAILLLGGCDQPPAAEYCWEAGFGCANLELPADSDEPLYIAGYHMGREITGVRDLQQARAMWISDGNIATVLIVVDCVGLGSGTVQEIRDRLSDFCKNNGCDSVNVISTHTHAGVDTLGLWGPMGMDGKNEDFMEILIAGAVSAAENAYEDRSRGDFYWSVTKTEGLQEDSRNPQTYDSNLYQLRFVPEDSAHNAIRLISFAAHAEALRSENTLVSRDYPGVVCDTVSAETGDDVVYVPGAIGGLILTPRFKEDVEENLLQTGRWISNRVLSATEGTKLMPKLSLSRVEFSTELDNTLFQYYKFLGILNNEVTHNLFGGYRLQTELNVVRMGDVALALIPGEVFPELVSGTKEDGDPEGLKAIAARYGMEKLMVIGLANDEIGYIVPPSDFVLHEDLPYVQEAAGDHYEETNSTGKNTAHALAEAFEKAVKELANAIEVHNKEK